MPKLIPQADDLSRPFWDGVNQKQLILQHCTTCDKLQYPIKTNCYHCSSSDNLNWKEVSGKGYIRSAIVIEDGRLDRRMPDQPYNLAVISLDEDPTINFYSNLPGVEAYKAPIGSSVEVIFEEVAPGQLIHEWTLVH
jgi:uncharacterized OB-fold protein|tara:strand:+ start:682 stop:1092 length:411 start_codon:yes stop_codon:yes gene_type:complete